MFLFRLASFCSCTASWSKTEVSWEPNQRIKYCYDGFNTQRPGRLMGGLFPCRFFWFRFFGRLPVALGRPPLPALLRASRWPPLSFPLNLREKMHNRLRTSNDSWDLRTETSKFGGTQASSMEAACVPVVFRQKSCAYRDFWRFSTESLPLDRRSNARPGIRGSQAVD